MTIKTTSKIINLFKDRKWEKNDCCHFSSEKNNNDHTLYLHTCEFSKWKEIENKHIYNLVEIENLFIGYIMDEIPELKKEEIQFEHCPF